jgi:hypothetical protein
MEKLILKRASASRPSGEWNDDDYDVLNYGKVVGRIMKTAASPVGAPWMWTLAYGYNESRSPTRGHEADREAAMKAFAKSWRQKMVRPKKFELLTPRFVERPGPIVNLVADHQLSYEAIDLSR